LPKNIEVLGVIARLAVNIEIIVNTRAAIFNSLLQGFDNSHVELFCLLIRNFISGSLGVNLCVPKCLICVDIAYPGNLFLIQY